MVESLVPELARLVVKSVRTWNRSVTLTTALTFGGITVALALGVGLVGYGAGWQAGRNAAVSASGALADAVHQAGPETEAALVAGPHGLSQPAVDAIELRPDIILTPLVAFDARLNRLGQGAGYYDRAFERFPDAWRIGVAWSVQQVADVPTEPWDKPLHAVVTEQGWIV